MKKSYKCGLMPVLKAAVIGPLVLFVDGDPLASPMPRQNLRVTVPKTCGFTPQVAQPEGEKGDSTPSGGMIVLD